MISCLYTKILGKIYNENLRSVYQIFEMLVNPGDNVLLDAPTYSGTLAAVRTKMEHVLPVISLDALEEHAYM